jgi:hypothetical protein
MTTDTGERTSTDGRSEEGIARSSYGIREPFESDRPAGYPAHMTLEPIDIRYHTGREGEAWHPVR